MAAAVAGATWRAPQWLSGLCRRVSGGLDLFGMRAVSEQYHGYCRACLMKALAQEAGAAPAEADVCLLYKTAAQLRERR